MTIAPHQKKILIVDDNPANIEVLYLHLEHVGYTVLVSDDGYEALNVAPQTQPDLIILDVMMPGINGFEVAAKLKATPATTNIPIIFMTALTDIANKIKGFDAGGVDYITKPFQYREVLARVQTQLTLHQQQEELEARARKLQEQNEDLDAFAHTVAHDLKNPLQIILTYTELLQQVETFSPKGKIFTDTIIDTTLKMNNIIEELQRLAWIRKDKINITPVHMHEQIEQALSRLQIMVNTYKPAIEIAEEFPTAQGYGPWVEEVWMNYLSNGMKYGGTPLKLAIGSEDQGDGYMRYWVRDNGYGIPVEEHARVFEKSIQLNRKSNDGYGLGLSITKRIIEKLGGKVGINATYPQGSEFYFTLPA